MGRIKWRLPSPHSLCRSSLRSALQHALARPIRQQTLWTAFDHCANAAIANRDTFPDVHISQNLFDLSSVNSKYRFREEEGMPGLAEFADIEVDDTGESALGGCVWASARKRTNDGNRGTPRRTAPGSGT